MQRVSRVFLAVVCLGGLASDHLHAFGSLLAVARASQPGEISQWWEYSADVYRTPTYSSLTKYEGKSVGTVWALNEREASEKAEAKIRGAWEKDNPHGGYIVTVEMDDGYPRPRPPHDDPEKKRADPPVPIPKKPLSMPPCRVSLKESGATYNVGRVIGSDHSCVIATLSTPSTITAVRVQAHDNLGQGHKAALWVYVDGELVEEAGPQRAVASGSLISWKLPRPVTGSIVSIVARHQDWKPDGSVIGTETAFVESIAVDYAPIPGAAHSAVNSNGILNVIIPSGNNKTHTFKCQFQNAKRVIVFADDNLNKSHRAQLEVSAGGKKIGNRQPVYAAGGWLIYNLEDGMTGDLVFKAYHENGAENGDEVRLHYVAVVK